MSSEPRKDGEVANRPHAQPLPLAATGVKSEGGQRNNPSDSSSGGSRSGLCLRSTLNRRASPGRGDGAGSHQDLVNSLCWPIYCRALQPFVHLMSDIRGLNPFHNQLYSQSGVRCLPLSVAYFL